MKRDKQVELEMLDDAARRLNALTGGDIRINGNSRGYVAIGNGGAISLAADQYVSFNVLYKQLLFAADVMRDAELTKRRATERAQREAAQLPAGAEWRQGEMASEGVLEYLAEQLFLSGARWEVQPVRTADGHAVHVWPLADIQPDVLILTENEADRFADALRTCARFARMADMPEDVRLTREAIRAMEDGRHDEAEDLFKEAAAVAMVEHIDEVVSDGE